jgi:ComF family protein
VIGKNQSMLNRFEQAFEALIQFIYPPRCALCDSAIRFDCHPSLRSGSLNRELRDSSPSAQNDKHPLLCTPCSASLNRVEADFTAPHLAHVWFDRARSVYPFEGKLRDALHGFKYGERFDLTGYLTCVLEDEIRSMERPDVIIPVPLHPKRLRKRGFNQAVMVARPLSKRLDVSLDVDALVRATDPGPQVDRERKERIQAVKGIFDVRDSRKIKGKKVLLIDDVLTTGATVNECARVLKKSGACRVEILTIARTL